MTMRPLPKSASQNQKPAPARKSERPSDALANVFAIPAAPLLPREATPDAIAPGPPLAQKDDGELTVGAESSEVINLDELDPAVTDDLKAAADSDKPPADTSPQKDSQGQPYDPGLTLQNGVFAGIPDDPSPAASSGGSSASTPMEELERLGIANDLYKLGLTIRPDGPPLGNHDLRDFRKLLVDLKWPEDKRRFKNVVGLLLRAVFPDEAKLTVPMMGKANAWLLATTLIAILRKRDLGVLADQLQSTLPDLPRPDTPPPLPTTPDKEK